MSDTFFSSDFHYGHKNLTRGTSNWSNGGQRDFDTLEEMNQALIDRINERVMKKDILYFLGDWSFGGFENVKKLRDLLNVETIHFIFGNHDHHIENNRGGSKGYFTTTQHYKEVTIAGQKIVMMHYPMKVWNGMHKGFWHLYGHCHGSLQETNGKSMDVGVDTNDLYPYHFDEIKLILDQREIYVVDHHDEGVN